MTFSFHHPCLIVWLVKVTHRLTVAAVFGSHFMVQEKQGELARLIKFVKAQMMVIRSLRSDLGPISERIRSCEELRRQL